MKNSRFPLLITISLLVSFLLASCSGTVINNWPGISAAEDTVYLAHQGSIFAINAQNGSLVWSFPADKPDPSKPFYAAPAVSENGLIVAGNYGHLLYGLNAQGVQQWVYDTETGHFVASPLIVEDSILAPSSNGTLYAVGLDGKPQWTFKTGNNLWAQPVSDGETAYLPALDHTLYALDLQSGSEVWSVDLGSALLSAPVLTEDGVLYQSTMDGDVVALDAESGNELWRTPTGGRVWSTPAFHEGTLYVGNAEGKVVAISAEDGQVAWQADAGSPIIGGGAIFNDGVAFPTEGGQVIAWGLGGDPKLWNQTINGKLYTTPVSADQTLVVPVTQGETLLQAIGSNGQIVWSFAAPK